MNLQTLISLLNRYTVARYCYRSIRTMSHFLAASCVEDPSRTREATFPRASREGVRDESRRDYVRPRP